MKTRIIPVWTRCNHRWERTDKPASAEDNVVHWKGKTLQCKSLINELGINVLYHQEDGICRLFDFSASHICRNQLTKVEILLRKEGC